MKKTKAIRTTLQVLFDTLIIFSSFILSFYLRGQIQLFGNEDVFSRYSNYMIWYILLVVVLKVIIFWLFGLYRRIWKYASMKDVVAIIEALLLSSVILIGIFYLLSYPIEIPGFNINFTLVYFPRSVLIIDFLLSFILIIISRFSVRFFNELRFGNPRTRKKRVLVVGAGDAGEMMAREMIRQRNSEYQPIGFLDDDYSKIKNSIHGIKVLGPISAMEDFINKFDIDEVLIAMPSANGKIRKEVAIRAKESGVKTKTLPSLYEVIDGRAHLYQIRDIEVEDILGRESVKIKTDEAISKFKDKTILVTGAGGSIGSEICRQLLRFSPSKLVLVNHSESKLFYIESELKNKYGFNSGVPVIANIGDKEVMKSVFREYKPEIVFHAAAYKHIPLMQLNPEAAIHNNFIGTKTIARISMEFGVKRFVFLSSNRAVKPKDIMGVSKLLAEDYLLAINGNRNTKFMIVRFGNVLESNGSVINIFKNQIRSGGPVSVTHPDMSRYVMTITESAQLAIQASLMEDGGEIFILDMGEPINILELAKNMIRLYGMKPEEDIDITYTGLREGEKLNEELLSYNEELKPSGFEHIYRINKKINRKDMLNILLNIEKEILTYDYKNLFKNLKKLIPEFDAKKMWIKL